LARRNAGEHEHGARAAVGLVPFASGVNRTPLTIVARIGLTTAAALVGQVLALGSSGITCLAVAGGPLATLLDCDGPLESRLDT
jgi:hypothetical protein